jgi:hypothetical protein
MTIETDDQLRQQNNDLTADPAGASLANSNFPGKFVNFKDLKGAPEMGTPPPQQSSVMHRWMNPVETSQYRFGWRLGNWKTLNEARKMTYGRWLARKLGLASVVELFDDVVNSEAAGENMGLQHLQTEGLTHSTLTYLDKGNDRNKRPQPSGSPLGDKTQ